jgi:type II secretory pathway component PulM
MSGAGSLLATWDRASLRERLLVGFAVVLVVLGLFYGVAWPALTRDIERTRQDLAHDRATLAYLQGRLQPVRGSAGPAGASPVAPLPTGPADAQTRAGVARVLAAHGFADAQVDLRDGRLGVVIPGAPFEALVAALDEIRRSTGLRVVEARLAARVDPGTVRADLTLGR